MGSREYLKLQLIGLGFLVWAALWIGFGAYIAYWIVPNPEALFAGGILGAYLGFFVGITIDAYLEEHHCD